MCARLSVTFAISFLTLAAAADVVNAAAPSRCAVPAVVDSSNEQQALKSEIVEADLKVGSDWHRVVPEPLPRLHWDRVPELVVLMPVMQYEKDRSTIYRATAQQLTDEEADALVADLTQALSVLTDNVFRGFAAVRRETAASGTLVSVMRPGQIVVARYDGVRDQLATIGFGGRSTKNDVIRAGSIILDNDFDRTRSERRLLRMHELGHALGYNHVQSRVSIMNPKVGPEPTDIDRAVARAAFRSVASASSCS